MKISQLSATAFENIRKRLYVHAIFNININLDETKDNTVVNLYKIVNFVPIRRISREVFSRY